MYLTESKNGQYKQSKNINIDRVCGKVYRIICIKIYIEENIYKK